METIELIKIQEMINALADKISAAAVVKDEAEPYQSKSIDQLAAALCVAQGAYPAVFQNSMGYNYMFSDLSEILKQVRKPLSDNGLSFYQFIEDNHGSLILHSRLLHASGQWIESRFKILSEAERIKEFASALIFLRRESACALLGLQPMQEDDDGQAAMKDADEQDTKGTDKRHNARLERPKMYESVTKEQLEELEYELNGWPDIAKDVMKQLDILSLADMPKKDYLKHISKIREIKLARSQIRA